MRNRTCSGGLVGLLALVAGCGAPGEEVYEEGGGAGGVTGVSTEQGVQVTAIELPSEPPSESDQSNDAGGDFFVGDMGFSSQEELDAFLAQLDGTSVNKGLYAKNRLWADADNISVCFTTDSDGTPSQKELVQEAITGSWQGYARVEFTGWGTCGGSGANITVRLHSSETGLSNIGTGSKGGSNNNPSMRLPTTGGEERIADVAIHEFGHALGLLHEFYRDDYVDVAYKDSSHDWNCTSADAQIDFKSPSDPAGAATNWGASEEVGAYDNASIMGYCRDGGAQLSDTDIETIQAMYGARTSIGWVLHRTWGFTGDVELSLEMGSDIGAADTVVQSNGTATYESLMLQKSVFGTTVAHHMPTNDPYSLAVECDAPTCSCGYNKDGKVPAGGFGERPATVTCYPSGLLIALL